MKTAVTRVVRRKNEKETQQLPAIPIPVSVAMARNRIKRDQKAIHSV